jgi:phosphohistidine phosphatase
MKTLYLVRHAKSSWATESQPDIDRLLNERGYADAHSVSKHLYAQKIRPDVIISSPAIRAMSTALIFAGNIRYSKEDILIRQKLYDTSREEYLACIHEINDSFSSAMIFGHNPVISETVEYCLHRRSEDMPTCCVICIEFDIDLWAKVTKNGGQQSLYFTPALLKTE